MIKQLFTVLCLILPLVGGSFASKNSVKIQFIDNDSIYTYNNAMAVKDLRRKQGLKDIPLWNASF